MLACAIFILLSVLEFNDPLADLRRADLPWLDDVLGKSPSPFLALAAFALTPYVSVALAHIGAWCAALSWLRQVPVGGIDVSSRPPMAWIGPPDVPGALAMIPGDRWTDGELFVGFGEHAVVRITSLGMGVGVCAVARAIFALCGFGVAWTADWWAVPAAIFFVPPMLLALPFVFGAAYTAEIGRIRIRLGMEEVDVEPGATIVRRKGRLLILEFQSRGGRHRTVKLRTGAGTRYDDTVVALVGRWRRDREVAGPYR